MLDLGTYFICRKTGDKYRYRLWYNYRVTQWFSFALHTY